MLYISNTAFTSQTQLSLHCWPLELHGDIANYYRMTFFSLVFCRTALAERLYDANDEHTALFVGKALCGTGLKDTSTTYIMQVHKEYYDY